MTTRYDYIKNLSFEEMAGEMVTQQFAGISTILTILGHKKETTKEVLYSIHDTLFEQLVEYLQTEVD